jgi:general secretion pathway protein A
MYANFFGLTREPFSLAPDPRYLFMSERHREALAHLLYGVGGGGGFVLLTGEIGAGKTTVCRCFLEQIPKRCNVAYIFNPKLTVIELLQSVCEEFRVSLGGLGPNPSVKDYVDPLNVFLLRTHAIGQNNVLIIDEAQNLSADVLEQLRLLTNLETNERKLLQIVLIGQPELRDMLARPELEQLAQRVVARFHLEALTEKETSRYIRHRLSVAGLSRPLPFDQKARRRVHQLSRGIPRRINLLCDRALLGAYAGGRAKVDVETVDKAASEVFDKTRLAQLMGGDKRRSLWLGGGVVAGVLLLGAMAWGAAVWWRGPPSRLSVAPAAPAAASGASKAASAVTAAASASASVVAATAPASAVQPLRTEAAAWHELAPGWNVTLDGGDPCLAAQRQQVQCFRGNTGLALVRLVGRPVVLTLHGDDGQPGYAVLVGLNTQSAVLQHNGVTQAVPLDELSKRWRGEFATFWRAPPGYTGAVADGQGGASIDWLAARLAALQGGSPPERKQTMDATLKAKVQAFQAAQGLKPDGIAGPTTFMLLNRATGVNEPRLQIGLSAN